MKLASRARSILQSDTRRLLLAIAIAAALLVGGLDLFRSPPAYVTLLAIPAALTLYRRPYLAAACLVIGALYIRLFWWYPDTGADQILVSQAAFDRVLSGLSPYGVLYPNPELPGATYPYGPWGWLVWRAGPIVEFVAFVGIMVILAARRAWLTLALLAFWLPSIIMTTSGVNDFSMTLLLLAALAVAESHPRLAAVLAAAATALKIQAFAWIVGLAVYLPRRAALLMAAVILLLWLPLPFWGIGSLLESIRLLDRGYQWNNGYGMNMPWLRVLLIPAAYFALRSRSVAAVGLTGAVIFFLILITPQWSSLAYWIPLLAMTGLAVEMWLQRASAAQKR